MRHMNSYRNQCVSGQTELFADEMNKERSRFTHWLRYEFMWRMRGSPERSERQIVHDPCCPGRRW